MDTLPLFPPPFFFPFPCGNLPADNTENDMGRKPNDTKRDQHCGMNDVISKSYILNTARGYLQQMDAMPSLYDKKR